MFANNHDGTFAEISGVVGLDFLEDGRAFALADLDQDGRLEVIVKNRNAPLLRILHNSMERLGQSIAFRLRGTKSNRDAIGTSITVTVGSLVQTRSLQAGTGFLSQHSKMLFFGIGSSDAPIHAVVHWPSGLIQRFDGLPRSSQVTLVEDVSTFSATPFKAATAVSPSSPARSPAKINETLPAGVGTWLLDPLRAPAFTALDVAGIPTRDRREPGTLYFALFLGEYNISLASTFA